RSDGPLDAGSRRGAVGPGAGGQPTRRRRRGRAGWSRLGLVPGGRERARRPWNGAHAPVQLGPRFARRIPADDAVPADAVAAGRSGYFSLLESEGRTARV